MKTIHPLYEGILAEFRPLFSDSMPPGTPGAIYRGRSREFSHFSKRIQPVGQIVIALFLGLAIGHYYPEQAESQNLQNTPAEQELQVMKKILFGVVEAVSALSQQQQRPIISAHDSNDTSQYPFPVSISSEKANLRAAPSWTAPTLLTLNRGAVLLAEGEQGGWLRVSTPKGVKAWVARDLTKQRENGA